MASKQKVNGVDSHLPHQKNIQKLMMPSLTRYYKTYYSLQVRNTVLRTLARCGPPARQSNQVILFYLTQNSLSLSAFLFNTGGQRPYFGNSQRAGTNYISTPNHLRNLLFNSPQFLFPEKGKSKFSHFSLGDVSCGDQFGPMMLIQLHHSAMHQASTSKENKLKTREQMDNTFILPQVQLNKECGQCVFPQVC